ncbi:replicative DNA helicase [Rhodopirellula bahusiensis]|uniref:replicative DNA helicase n=2 Tax=Rhodopirellula bahusiensis TaxID=2014065 RepID=UPI003266E291
MSEKHLPDDEAAVIGAMIHDAALVDEVVSRVEATEFTDSSLRELFITLVDMRNASKPWGTTALVSELRATGSYERIGPGTIAALSGAIASKFHATFHADRVRSSALVANLQALGRRLATVSVEKMTQRRQTPKDLLDALDAELMRLRQTDVAQAEVRNVGDVALNVCDSIDKSLESGSVRGLRTGLTTIDKVNGGYQPGTLNVLTARPSNGKSVLGLQFATSIGRGFQYQLVEGQNNWFATQEPTSTLFVSLEMTEEELGSRSLADAANVDGRHINTHRVTDHQRHHLRQAAEEMSGSKAFLYQPIRATVAGIRAAARIHQRKHGLGCLIVDYLQLIDSEEGTRDEKETYRVGRLCRDLKSIALEFDIPVIVLSQLNRDAENKPPTLSQLADSGKIEQHADTVVAIHRIRGDSEEAQLVFLKWRNGMTPTRDVHFDRKFCRFVDPPEPEVEPHPEFAGYATS